jgi:hypothetical protein
MLTSKINLLIYLAVWRRPEITELCFMGIERMKKHSAYNIEAFAVISEPGMIQLCNKYGIKWFMTDNYPLGKKKNTGLRAAERFDFDYLMEIGSDDLITNDLLTQYLDYFGKYDFFGITDAAYIESETGACRRLTTDKSTYGAGRIISRKILNQMNWTLWSDSLNRGLDNNSLYNIETKTKVKYHKVKHQDVPGVIDVKSSENLWKFNYFIGEDYNLLEIYKRLSEQEVNRLITMQNVSA